MKLATLTFLLSVPTPLTFYIFVFLSSFFFSYAVLNHMTNYRYQLVRPVRVTNTRDQRV